MEQYVLRLACADGKAAKIFFRWLEQHFGPNCYPDTLTNLGTDGVLAFGDLEVKARMRDRAQQLIFGHEITNVFVEGHGDCLGNQVESDTHRQHVLQACNVVEGWKLKTKAGRPVNVIGVYVSKRREAVEVLCGHLASAATAAD